MMSKHIIYDLVIMVLIIAGLLADGLQPQDAYFAVATALWLFQPEIEKEL